MTLFVPLFTVILIYLYTSSNIRSQIEVSSQNSLKQFLSAVDTIAGEMGDICIAMVENEECIRYAMSQSYVKHRKQNEILTLIDALDIYSQERYYDVFVYYPMEDRIVSATKASTTAWHYYNSYYSSSENWGNVSEEWEIFSDFINCSSTSPIFMTIEKDGYEYLCVAEKQYRYSNEKYNYVTAVVLQPQFLENLIGEGILSSDTLFMMFNEKGKVILSSDSALDELNLKEHNLSQNGGEISIEKEKYMLWVQESENIRGYYATAVPIKYFNEQLRMINLLCGNGILICIVVSIWIAWKGSLRSWNPFEGLYMKLASKENRNIELNAQNELEYIDLLFQRTQEEKRLLRDKAFIKKNLWQDMLLLSLLEGTGTNIKETKNLLKEKGLGFQEECFCVCFIQAEQKKDLEAGTLFFILQNVFEEQLSNIGKANFVVVSKNRSCLLVNCPSNVDSNHIKKVITEGKVFIEKNFDLVLTIGISNVCTEIQQISDCYKESITAFEYRYFKGAGTVIIYSDIKDKGFSYDVFMKNNLSNIIMEYVCAEEFKQDNSSEFCEQVLRTYGIDIECSLDTMECFKFEMLNAMYKVMTNFQYSQLIKKEKLEQLLATPFLNEFKQYWIDLLNELCEKNQQMILENDICLQAKKYIEDHYGDTELSLDFLGEILGCSSSYLSRKFKERWDVSIIEYITDIRIARSKELLEDTEITVQEIAELTGYLSSSSFVKTFKKKTGITPGAYRKSARNLQTEKA